jgi:hypothetical protein
MCVDKRLEKIVRDGVGTAGAAASERGRSRIGGE